MKAKILLVLAAVPTLMALLLVIALPVAFIVMKAFNGFAPSVLGLDAITYWQAFSMTIFIYALRAPASTS